MPTSLRLRVLLGGILPTIGFAILAVFGSMASAFVVRSELMTVGHFAAELRTTNGVVTTVESLPIRSFDRRVHRIAFRYEVDRREFTGSAYDDDTKLRPGTEVIVEHVATAPELARIQGTRTAPFSSLVAFVLVFPIVGIGLVIGGLIANRRRVQLLRDGDSAWGVLTGREATSTKVDNQRVYSLEFTFVDAAGERRVAHERSHRQRWFDGTPRATCSTTRSPAPPAWSS